MSWTLGKYYVQGFIYFTAGCKDGTPNPSSDDRVPAIPPAISKEQKRTETELSLKKVFGHVEDEQESGRSLSGLTGEWTPLPLFLVLLLTFKFRLKY